MIRVFKPTIELESIFQQLIEETNMYYSNTIWNKHYHIKRIIT